MGDSDDTKLNLIFGGISILGLIILSFLAGAYVTEFQVFPYKQLLAPPFKAVKARVEKQTRDHSPKGSIWWKKVKHDKQGVTVSDAEKAFQGYTVYETVHSAAYMLDMEGNRVHKWEMPFHEAWPDPPHVPEPVKEKAIHWSGAHVFPNGDVLANYTADGDTPYGYGLIKLDKDSNIIWKYSDHVHHDFTVADDGHIWALTHEFEKPTSGEYPTLPGKFTNRRILTDYIVELSPEGEELQRISLTKAVADSKLVDKLANWHRGKNWDMLHTNNVEPIPQTFARHHDFAEPGQLLVSFREINAIALIDPDEEKATWWTRGFWVKQHDPDPLDNGNILIFDNQGYRGPGGMSRIAEFNPANGKIAWSYTGDDKNKFVTRWGGKQSMLPNGNVLISENLRSRLFEVNRDGEIVWEMYNPLRAKADGKEFVATISGGHQRMSLDYPTFLDE